MFWKMLPFFVALLLALGLAAAAGDFIVKGRDDGRMRVPALLSIASAFVMFAAVCSISG